MAVDWSNLEQNILEYIAENWLLSLEDYAAFSSVCSSWHRAATAVKPNFTPLPWLLLSEKEEESKRKHEDLHKRNLFSLVSNKCYNVSLPQASGNKRCIGTGSVWILTVGLDRDFHLFNPLTNTQLDLPSEIPELAHRFGKKEAEDDFTGEWYRDNFIRRALVVEFNGELLVLITYHDIYEYVAVARPGDAIWTDPKISRVVDVTYSAKLGLILFLKDEGQLCSWDFHGLVTNNTNTSTSTIMNPLLFDYPPTPAPTPDEDDQLKSEVTTYLLESFNGNLLIVQRYAEHAIVLDDDDENSDKVVPKYKDNRYVDFHAYKNDIEKEKWTYETYYFDVYKLDLDKKEWEEIDDLGSMALFVGDGPATSVDTKTFPTLKRNSIYFNDDAGRYFWKTTVDGLGGRDMRVFDVVTGSFESFYHGDDYLSSHSPPVWFLPQVSDLPKSYKTTQL